MQAVFISLLSTNASFLLLSFSSLISSYTFSGAKQSCVYLFMLVWHFFVSCPLQDCTGVKTKEKEMQNESFFGTKTKLLGLP